MAANACPNQPIGTNDNQSLWEGIKDISADDFVGMVQTFFNEVADKGKIPNRHKSLKECNVLQKKFIIADIIPFLQI